jgi:toxin-antitoxin system PIN domain toxin
MTKVSDPILVDVNILMALGWASHPHHPLVTARIERQHGPWFTCALTELGFIRLSANPVVTKAVVSAGQAARLLARITTDSFHRFAPEIVPLEAATATATFDRVLGPHQVTGAYLLALAAKHKACFLTLDSRFEALAKGVADLEILRP